jgi:alpha-ketoglutarate-dependent taurine dioxygenase
VKSIEGAGAMIQAQDEAFSHAVNHSSEADAPSGDVVRIGRLPGEGGSLPLVLTPARPDRRDADTLGAWLEDNRAFVERRLVRHGALLFRGFDAASAPALERVARAVDPELKNDYLGTSPRNAVKGSAYVFSASELPPYYPIPEHIEMSFVKSPPRSVFFGCFVAPGAPGGETPLVDFRRVYQDLDPAVRARFDQKGVRNIRNYAGPEGGSRLDLWKLKRWDEMFGTTSREKVEAICRDNEFEPTWRPGGRLRLVNTQPATRVHPVTGETVWFNHSQVFHLSAVPAEYGFIAGRLGKRRYRALQQVARAMVLVKGLTKGSDDQAMHCTYGDGAAIPDSDMDRVREAIWKNMVAFRWEVGDVVAIDNRSTAHGRLPYSGPRTIAVAWA